MSIVLVDNLSANRTFIQKRVLADGSQLFAENSGRLLGQPTIKLSITEGNNGRSVNRVRGVLSLPSVTDCSATDCGTQPVVNYTEIGSFDFAIMQQASDVQHAQLLAMFSSLVASTAVEQLVKNAIRPD